MAKQSYFLLCLAVVLVITNLAECGRRCRSVSSRKLSAKLDEINSTLSEQLIDANANINKLLEQKTDFPACIEPCQPDIRDMWFRTTIGIGKDSVTAWRTGDGATDDPECRNVRKNGCRLHYRDPRIDTWSLQKITKVQYSIYKDGKQVAWVLFNAVGSTMDNWFDKSRVIGSSYNDLTSSAAYNFFAIKDESPVLFRVTRHWYVSSKFAGCGNDDYWFVTEEGTGNCGYDRLTQYPYILYSLGPTMANTANQENFGFGDVAVVRVIQE
ncbi:uncharacterized protein LOC123539046 [Mercenaria mercenaria]|uniref:uncharacterized protein LOC123539046 n=1 Tax=Mercenaria mercenaria TaxID=6596 RepID=UPI001E1E0872|nr:uncharacterized protein LOC123539046 [Mercenaria mercenaria]